MFFGIDKSNGDSPGRSKNDNHSCEQLAASVDPRTIQIQYDPTWSNNIIQWYPMIMSGDWLIDQRYSTNHLDLIGIIRSPTGNMMIIPSPIPWGYHGLNLGGPKASLDSADDWGRHAGWPQFFFGFGSAQGVPQGSCEHFVSKNTEDSKIHSASHEKHFKTVMDPREWTTEIGQFYLVFPCVLLFFWGLETTSNSFETVIWSSLGWSNMKDPLGAT